jgi:DNA polymerase
VERALYDALPKLPDAEEKVWRMDTRINERGLPIDMDLVDSMIEIASSRLYDLEQEALKLTGGLRVTQRDKVLEWLSAEGGGVDTLQAKELTDTLAADILSEIPENVARLLEIRLEAGKVSTKKLTKIKEFISADNRVRGTLLYHGATTGRWSGKLLQPHNFVRPLHGKADQARIVDLLHAGNVEGAILLYPEPLMTLLGSAMRGVLCAPDGRVLNVADYAAIEARDLVWTAGQQDAIERYRQNIDQYKIMASHIFGIPVGLIDSAQRKVGKDVILGCGFGMGVDKFILTCEQRGAPVERNIAERGVYGYRDTHPMVPKFWRLVENAAIAAVSNPGKIYKARDIRFYVQDRFLFVQLPSGRRLAYPDPEVRTVKKFGDFKAELTFMGEGKNKQWMRLSTYGGKLVENIVQAIARDIMVQGMHNVEAAGYDVVGTVHDEIISETDEGFGSVEGYEKLLCEMPQWGGSCPIAAEGFFAKRWRK